MKRLDWHTFAGGTGAAEGKYAYQAITGGLNGREMYMIDPRTSQSGRHIGYVLRYFGARGYETLDLNARVATLKKKAREHFLSPARDSVRAYDAKKNPARKRRAKKKPIQYFPPVRAKRRRKNPARPLSGGMEKHKAASVRRGHRVARRKRGEYGRAVHSFQYKIQLERKGKWITLAAFFHKPYAVEYGNALKARYPSKNFRIAWE